MKRVVCWTLVCVLLVCLTACSGGNTEESAPPTAVTTHTTGNFLGIRIDELLSKEQIEAAVGCEMRDPEVKESGMQLYALATDASCSVKLNAQIEERSRFDSTVQSLPDAIAAPNLGEVAWWVEEYRTLFVYAKGYSLNVSIDGTNYDGDTLLMLSRQLAAIVVDKL